MYNNIIEIRNLTKAYENFTLDNISFDLPKGSIMGFVGENGAGKTTTIKLLLNQQRKDYGNAKIFGLDTVKDETEIKKDVGVVFSENYFPEEFTPLIIGKVINKAFLNWDNNLYDKYLNVFDLPRKMKLKEYSKGMKTKVAVAAALAHKPKLLILDETTSNMDPIARNEIMDILLDFIQDEERSVLFSTHITSDLEKIADYITYIRKGKIILSDSLDNLRDNYGVVKCGKGISEKIEKNIVAGVRYNEFSTDVLVKDKKSVKETSPDLIIDRASIEDIMTYMKG